MSIGDNPVKQSPKGWGCFWIIATVIAGCVLVSLEEIAVLSADIVNVRDVTCTVTSKVLNRDTQWLPDPPPSPEGGPSVHFYTPDSIGTSNCGTIYLENDQPGRTAQDFVIGRDYKLKLGDKVAILRSQTWLLAVLGPSG